MTQFLLDTNVLLWYFEGSKRILPLKNLLTSVNSDVYVSVISFWEIIIKIRKGRLKIDFDDFSNFIKENAFFELPITSAYNKAYMELPKHHNDPFDHMLLAQAIACPMRFITGDKLLAEYSSLVMVV